MELFQNVVSVRSPAVVENVTLPCTDMLRKMVSSILKWIASNFGRKLTSYIMFIVQASCKSANKSSYSPVSVSCEKWLKSEPGHDFNSWQKRRHKVFGDCLELFFVSLCFELLFICCFVQMLIRWLPKIRLEKLICKRNMLVNGKISCRRKNTRFECLL